MWKQLLVRYEETPPPFIHRRQLSLTCLHFTFSLLLSDDVADTIFSGSSSFIAVESISPFESHRSLLLCILYRY